MARLFVPQSKLEEWALEDKADIRDGKLALPTEKASFAVLPAVHFTKLVSGTDDKKLLRKVKTEDELHRLGAEHLADSVLLGDTAYEVTGGYVTEVPRAAGTGKKGVTPEAEALAAFLLDKLS
ncbi:MAG TPA: hypothetical protein VIG99_26265 [Myxococcaceae bacterium]